VLVAIIGHEAAKFTPETKLAACRVIMGLLNPSTSVLVSGRCPLGGVDVWAEICADKWGRAKRIFPPRHESWERGYKPRNLAIARTADVVHVIALAAYPDTYIAERFPYCYHCAKDDARQRGADHVKGGACWTARQAMALGKPAHWHIIHAP